MLTLAIDTTCGISSLAIFNESELVSCHKHHSQKLQTGFFKVIDGVLRDHGLGLENFDRIITGVGPGSFTGVRIGVSFAKTICQFGKAELCAIESYYLGINEFEDGSYYIPLIASTKSECYSTVFRIDGGNIRIIRELDDGPPVRIVKWLQDIDHASKVYIYGESVLMLDGSNLPRNLNLHVSDSHESMPDASRALKFLTRFKTSVKSVDPFYLKPVYVRPSPAEMKLMKTGDRK